MARRKPLFVDLEADIEHLIRVQRATMQEIDAAIMAHAEQLKPVDAATANRRNLPPHLK